MKAIRVAAVLALFVSVAGGCTCSNKDACEGVVCAASDSCHSPGVCSEGKCSNPAKADGASCDDGNRCTVGDSCKAGVCSAGTAVTCAATDACHTAGTCDSKTGACTNPVAADGTTCDDGNVCTQSSSCVAGVCKGSNPVADGTTCDDHNDCTTADACQAGVCKGTSVEDGSTCDDHNACTQADSCLGGVCTGGNPVVCNSSGPCHPAGICDRGTGECSAPVDPDGTSCNADNEVSGEQCTAGVCECPAGTEACNGACLATASYQTDANNCGQCGNACAVAIGQVCRSGACASLCLPGQAFCSGVCVDPSTDSKNCGVCGNACPGRQVCSAGVCQPECGPGLELCGAACVRLDHDLNNCGGCGNSCSSGQLCAGGTCVDKGLATSCLPTSSIGVDLDGPNVTAFVPNGAWGKSIKGVQVVPVEGDGGRVTIDTPDVVNSCATNANTHQTVCNANGTDVYVIEESALNATLTSSGSGTLSFTGGRCTTCGVAMDGLNNKAWLAVATDASNHGGFEGIDLGTMSSTGVILANDTVSEDIAIDPVRGLILSPNEDANYQLVDLNKQLAYDNFIQGAGRDFDSAAEDCTTGIALSTSEFSGIMVLADLSQAEFTDGTPNGTWTAPTLVQNFPEFASLGAGTSAVVVAPGSHLAVVGGEFGGSLIGAMRLQSVSGPGTTPNVPDYVVMNIPNTPDGQSWEMGWDPHTVTAYVSPSSGHAFALVANGNGDAPTWLAVIDIEAMMAAPRDAGHTVDRGFDPVAHGVVSFISIQ